MGLSSEAKAARYAYKRAWESKNREKVNAYQREYRRQHPEKVKQYHETFWNKKAQEKEAWIKAKYSNNYICPKCGYMVRGFESGCDYKYCPYCGKTVAPIENSKKNEEAEVRSNDT